MTATIAVSSCAPQLVNVSVELTVHTETVWPVVCCVDVCSWTCPLISSDARSWTKSLQLPWFGTGVQRRTEELFNAVCIRCCAVRRSRIAIAPAVTEPSLVGSMVTYTEISWLVCR